MSETKREDWTKKEYLEYLEKQGVITEASKFSSISLDTAKDLLALHEKQTPSESSTDTEKEDFDDKTIAFLKQNSDKLLTERYESEVVKRRQAEQNLAKVKSSIKGTLDALAGLLK